MSRFFFINLLIFKFVYLLYKLFDICSFFIHEREQYCSVSYPSHLGLLCAKLRKIKVLQNQSVFFRVIIKSVFWQNWA